MSDYASVRAVVFDAVGTLIYPSPPAAVVYYEVGRQHGSRLTQEDVARNFNRVLKQHNYAPRTDEQLERQRWRRIVADVFTDLDNTESLFVQLWDHFARASSWAVYEDVLDALANLNAAGLLTAIGSNFDERLLAISRELSALRLTHRVFVSSQLGHTKPSLDFFRAVEAGLQLRPDQLLMVGDDPRTDVNGANSAGWHCLLLNRRAVANGVKQIHSLRELVSVLT